MGNSLNKALGERKSANKEPKTREYPLSNTERSSLPNLSTPGNKQGEKKKVGDLGDRLYESVISNLTLLEGLASRLDKPHPYGRMKYWKHLAEHFEVKERIYKTFPCCPENSPTEDLLYLLKTQKAPEEFTIKKLEEGLDSIDRNDVIEDVVMKHKELDSKLTDETVVGSLFDSHPLIIGEIAVLLDVNEAGKKNWRQLADWFGVPKSESQNFAESIQDNPTEDLLDYIVKCLNPKMTVGRLQSILEDLQMLEVSGVLTNSKKVTKNTLLKDLWDQDYEAVDNLCNHLNQMYNSRIRGWRRLGYKLKIKKDFLDKFSPNEGEVISPTEALFHHLGGAKVWLTMEDLIWALASIGREDALPVIKDYFPGRDVDIFLERKRAQTSGN